jgi:transporter family protein
MAAWFWYAVVAAVLYGAHQIFTRTAAERIGEGLGGFLVEASTALSILIYLAILWLREDGIKNPVEQFLTIHRLPGSA